MSGNRKKRQNANKKGANNTSNTEDQKDVSADAREPDSEDIFCLHAKNYKPPNCSSNEKKGKQKQKNIISLKCLDCIRDKADSSETEGLWLCLHCFESRCGRYCDNTHALKHFESDNDHCLSINITSWQVWCYHCDNYVSQRVLKGKLESTLSSVKKQLKLLKPPKRHVPMEVEMVEFPLGEAKPLSFRVIGLTNLGNTCYFNSALQNLLYLAPFKEQLFHTLHRTEYRLVPKKHPDLKPITFQYTDSEAAEPGDLTKALSSLMKQTIQVNEQELVTGKKSVHRRCITSPRTVQNAVAKRHRKFSNGSQQDSHELLRYLIDMVKDEEIKRLKVAFLEHFDAKDHKSQFKSYSEEKKKLLRKYASEFKNIFVFTGTFIDDIFGGKLLSIVECHSCRNAFDVNEDFLDISLALPVERYEYKPAPHKDTTKKQQKQLNKAEKKKLKKQNSKTYDVHTFNKKSDFRETSKRVKEPSQEIIPNEGSESVDMREESTDTNGETERETSPVVGSQGSEPDKRLSSDMNGLNIDTEQVPETETDNLSGETETEEISDQIPESTAEDNLMGDTAESQNSLPTIIIDNSECSTDNLPDLKSVTDSSQIESHDISSGEVQSNSQTELHMAVDSSQTDHSTATHSETAEQPIEPKECKVKSKKVTRLRRDNKEHPHSSLEHYINRFFSAETLQGDYLCVLCNPQLQPAADEDRQSSCSGDDKEDKESSGESIDLTKCHFSNATKQFHVLSLPPILTIHLKRFSQSGSRLHKVNKHIDFPLVLDMGPYCTSDIAATMDTDCRILYGLRGIVQHSGGMVAGHYIAYVNIADWNSHVKVYSPKGKSLSDNNVAGVTQCENMDTDREVELGETTDSRMKVSRKDSATEIQCQDTICSEVISPSQPTTHIVPSEDWYYISDSSVSKVSSQEVFRSQAYILFYERLTLITSL